MPVVAAWERSLQPDPPWGRYVKVACPPIPGGSTPPCVEHRLLVLRRVPVGAGLIRWLAASPVGTGLGGVVPTELDRQYRFLAPEL
jgi:hypothetical protein